jgi:hypothetical protein
LREATTGRYAARFVKVAAGDDYWQPGEIAHFEYHLTHPGRSDYRLWSRTQQPVTVLGPGSHPHNDRTFRVRFRDGHEGIAAADELVDHPGHFRPEFAYHPQALHQHVNLHQAAAECNPASYPYGIMPQHCLSPAMPPEQGVMPPPEPMKGPGGGGGGGKGPSGTAQPSGSTTPTPAGEGAERWRPMVHERFQEVGPQHGITDPNELQKWEDAAVSRIGIESGGDPTAVNDWDSNAQAGTPSKGLLQFIQPSFNAVNPSGNWLDPKDQIDAFIPYSQSRGLSPDTGLGTAHNY